MDIGHLLIFLLEGVPLTFFISIIAFLAGLGIGLPLAFARVYEPETSFAVNLYEKFFRGVPEIVLMLAFCLGLGLYFPVPFANPFFTAAFVLGLRSGANQQQIFRGAIRGVGDEQMIAAQSTGLSKWQAIWHVMIPQVLTYSTPGLGSEYSLLIKDSAYAWVIGVPELMERSVWYSTSTFDLVTPFVIGAIVYITITFPIAQYLDHWGNRKKKGMGL